jgi:hypothetical protein
LDYLQVLTTTCDLLIQVYTKIQFYLGGSTATSGSHLSSSGALSQGLAEVVLKIDGKLKVNGIFSLSLSLSPSLTDDPFVFMFLRLFSRKEIDWFVIERD